MKKYTFLFLVVVLLQQVVFAQEENRIGFNKKNLFTGGNVSFGFGNRSFTIGASPNFGYSITNWADIGVVANYTYSSFREVVWGTNDKIRQSIYGGGGFIKIYPVNFLFVQAQYEHNFISQKYLISNTTAQKSKFDAGSTLLGGGYTSGRYGRGGNPFFYLSLLFDVSGNTLSPYTDANGNTIVNIRGGIQIPLFQGLKD